MSAWTQAMTIMTIIISDLCFPRCTLQSYSILLVGSMGPGEKLIVSLRRHPSGASACPLLWMLRPPPALQSLAPTTSTPACRTLAPVWQSGGNQDGRDCCLLDQKQRPPLKKEEASLRGSCSLPTTVAPTAHLVNQRLQSADLLQHWTLWS